MNPKVSRLKFEAEVERVRAYAAKERPGFSWEVVEVGQHRFLLDMGLPTGRRLLMRVDAYKWDDRAPSFHFVERQIPHQVLPVEQWPGPPRLNKPFGPFHAVHPGNRRQRQPVGKQKKLYPFVCLPGVREYHTHPQHARTRWEDVKASGAYTILDTLIRIQNRINETMPVQAAA